MFLFCSDIGSQAILYATIMIKDDSSNISIHKKKKYKYSKNLWNVLLCDHKSSSQQSGGPHSLLSHKHTVRMHSQCDRNELLDWTKLTEEEETDTPYLPIISFHDNAHTSFPINEKLVLLESL